MQATLMYIVRHLALFDLIVGSGLLMQQARLPLRQLALIVVRPLCIRNMLLLNQLEHQETFLRKIPPVSYQKRICLCVSAGV